MVCMIDNQKVNSHITNLGSVYICRCMREEVLVVGAHKF